MKTNLIKALKTAIHALENNTIHYEWTEQSSCNCGVVAQCILGKNKEQIQDKFDVAIDSLRRYDSKDKKVGFTWQNGIKYLCPITGKSSVEIFNDLFEKGMSREDIVHLEYLDNAAILKRAKLETPMTKTVRVKTGTIKKQVPIETTEGRFFKKKVIKYVEQTEEIFEERKETSMGLEKDYHTKKPNLIKYLKAWAQILEEGEKQISTQSSKTDLQEELLKAVATEDFERAAQIRDTLAIK